MTLEELTFSDVFVNKNKNETCMQNGNHIDIQGGSKSKLLYCVNSLLFLSHPVHVV